MADSIDELPIFPLNTVLFPDGLLPLRVFEARYMDMARKALKEGSGFGVCRIAAGSEVGAPAQPESIGTIATITDCDMEQLGVLLLKTRGSERFRIVSQQANSQGLIIARIQRLEADSDAPVPERYLPCVRILQAIVTQQGEAVFHPPLAYDSARWVGHRLSEILPLPGKVKQHMLELDDSLLRLQTLLDFLQQHGLTIR